MFHTASLKALGAPNNPTLYQHRCFLRPLTICGFETYHSNTYFLCLRATMMLCNVFYVAVPFTSQLFSFFTSVAQRSCEISPNEQCDTIPTQMLPTSSATNECSLRPLRCYATYVSIFLPTLHVFHDVSLQDLTARNNPTPYQHKCF